MAGVLGGLLGAATLGLAPAAGRALSTAFSPVARAEKQMLREDVKKLQTGVGLGLSEAEKTAGTAGAIQAAQAAQAGLIDEARRRGDFGALTRMSEQAATAGAGARLGMEQGSQQLAQQRAADIRARMTARRQELAGFGAQAGKDMAPGLAALVPGQTGLSADVVRGAAASAYR